MAGTQPARYSPGVLWLSPSPLPSPTPVLLRTPAGELEPLVRDHQFLAFWWLLMAAFDNIWNKTIRTVFLSFYSQFILNNLYSSKLLDLLYIHMYRFSEQMDITFN